MFSKSVKYAIKASLYLAVHSSEENKIVINDIAKPINVPKAYIAKLLQTLSKQNLISSAKGPKGGFYLSEANRKNSINSIISAVEGEAPMHSCLLSLRKCNSDNPCSLHHLVFDEKQKILKSLDNETLDSLSNHIKEGKSVLPL